MKNATLIIFAVLAAILAGCVTAPSRNMQDMSVEEIERALVGEIL